MIMVESLPMLACSPNPSSYSNTGPFPFASSLVLGGAPADKMESEYYQLFSFLLCSGAFMLVCA
jgi:hypothetical protein